MHTLRRRLSTLFLAIGFLWQPAAAALADEEDRPVWAQTDWMAHDTTRLVQEAQRYSQFSAYDEAYERLIIAAQRGYPAAQAYVGFYYQEGLAVEADPVEAVKWFLLSGDQTAGHYARELGKSMTDEDYAEAEQRAADWEPTFE